jgi:benzoylformate decarboxylase
MTEPGHGAEVFVRQLVAAGVRWIFGNPGTTEQALIDRLQDHDGIDLILALHEGVAVAAAEGYARASGTVGVVQLHAGPGLGNGMGMLYNARAGQTPLVVYVGQSQQPTLYQEPTLSTDLVLLAAPVAKWAHEVRTAQEIPQVLRRAFKVAMTPPRGPVVVAVPMDLMEAPCTAPVLPPSYVATGVRPDPRAIEDAATVLLDASSPAIVVGDGVSSAGARAAVGALARLLGAPIFGGSMSEVVTEPGEPLRAARLPFDGRGTLALLDGYDAVVAVGTKVFAQLFPADGWPLADRPLVHIGLDPWELGKNQPATIVFGEEQASVEELVAAVESGLTTELRTDWASRRALEEDRIARSRRRVAAGEGSATGGGPMPVEDAVAAIAAALPDDVRLVDETISAYGVVAGHFDQPPGHWFRGRGGGIGGGMAMPIGVQLADPDSTVVCLTADGSAMYSITALWTAAHHRLPIVWIVLDNRGYRLLKLNTLQFTTRSRPAGRAFVGADLVDPELDFVAVAQGMGVPAERVTTPEQIGPAVKRALARRAGPSLIQVVVDGDVPVPA